ncbi:MAG: hypothetical protein WCM76_09220 [Bacteroidota bacterium]
MKHLRLYLFILIPLGVFVIIRVCFGFNGLYGQDSHEYLRFAEWIRTALHGSAEPTSFFWPVIYPMLGGLVSYITGNTALVLQLISLCAFIISLFFFRGILLMWHPTRITEIEVFILVTILPASWFLRGAIFVMSDITAVMFTFGAVYYLYRITFTAKALHLMMGALFTVLAFFTRYPAALIIAPWAVYATVALFRKFRFLSLAGALLVLVGCSFLLLQVKSENITGLITHPLITYWSINNFLASSFSSADGSVQYYLANVLYAFSAILHPAFLLPGWVLVFFIRRRDTDQWHAKLALMSVVMYSLLLMGLAFQNPRFLMLSFPMIAFLCLPAFIRVYTKLSAWRFMLPAFIILIIMADAVVFTYSFRSFYRLNKLEQTIASDLVTNHSGNTAIYTFSIDPALRSYHVANPIRNMWVKEYDDFEKGALVLYNCDAFKRQWKDRNPVKNWEKLQKEHQLLVLSEYSDGWKLYEIR